MNKILNIQSWICTYPGYPFVGFHEDAPERFVANTPWQHLRLAQWSTDHFPKSPRHPEGEGKTCRCDFCFILFHRFATWFMRKDSVSVSCPCVSLFFLMSTRLMHLSLFTYNYKCTVTIYNPTTRLLYWNILQNTCIQWVNPETKLRLLFSFHKL